MMCANNRVHYDLMVEYSSLHSTLPHYNHYADLFEGIELLNACQIYFVSSVSKIKSVPSITFRAIYGTVHIQLTHFCYDDCENTCIWSYYHHQIGSMTRLPLFRVRSWNNGMRCVSLYILLNCATAAADWIFKRKAMFSLPTALSSTGSWQGEGSQLRATSVIRIWIVISILWVTSLI